MTNTYDPKREKKRKKNGEKLKTNKKSKNCVKTISIGAIQKFICFLKTLIK